MKDNISGPKRPSRLEIGRAMQKVGQSGEATDAEREAILVGAETSRTEANTVECIRLAQKYFGDGVKERLGRAIEAAEQRFPGIKDKLREE